MLFFLSFFLQRFVGGVTGISVSRTSIVLSSTVLLGKNISSKDTSNKSKDETSTSEHNLNWDNFPYTRTTFHITNL